jgi:hypothetical protein
MEGESGFEIVTYNSQTPKNDHLYISSLWQQQAYFLPKETRPTTDQTKLKPPSEIKNASSRCGEH